MGEGQLLLGSCSLLVAMASLYRDPAHTFLFPVAPA